MIGKSIGHYRILDKLGEGGMGVVYRAEDNRLGRNVAIKVLPAEMASKPERLERFQREAKALAALDHPGIVTVYSVEESAGLHFLTMQLAEGEPLDQLIPEGGLGVEKIVEIGTAVAEALAAAHEKGIVHRDLKPSNIMVSDDGRSKVLDFGLAKFSALPSDPALDTQMPTALHTREGVVMGTVPYMSPEQVAGRGLDPRTDLYSLGVVLYEMAAGRRPFLGQSSAELASAILRDRPGPLAAVRSDLAPGLARVIERCLEKDPEARFATAQELGVALRQAVAAEPLADAAAVRASSSPASRSAGPSHSGAARAEEGFWVAVMPFRHAAGDADAAALAEGLSEEIVTGLARFSYLRVVSRSSTARYADAVGDVRTVGQELGARYVMEGSLRRVGKKLRVTVQLVDTVSGTHLWAETYDRDFDPEQLFAIQDDLVPRIVSTIADWYGALPHSMSEAVRSRRHDQLSAYEVVLRSFGYFERITPEEHDSVRAGLERAVEQESGNADGWAMLSMMYGEEHRFGFNARPEPLSRAVQAARRAVDAAHANHFAWLALAQAHFFRKEFDAFRDAADRAIALNPMDGSTLEYLAHLLAFSGDWERGCELAERARELNPNHPGWYWVVLALDAYRKNDYENARSYLAKAILRGGGAQVFTQALLAAADGQLGDREAAEESVRKILSLEPAFGAAVREEFGKWYPPELVEHLTDGLRKAGLGVSETSAASAEIRKSADRLLKSPPASTTPLLGREAALEAALELLHGGARVLTVTGYGGTGKTRFSIELFDRLAPEVDDAAVFVPLASIDTPSQVLPAICVALDIGEARGRSALDALSAVIADRRVLLVLDNLEQVLDVAADIAELVSRCPSLQVIATSRAPLRIGPESEFALPPLALPDAHSHSLEELERSPSIALLLQRAARVRPGFELTPDNAEAIVAICRHLDGLPLALELAAARLRILEPAALLDRLDNALDLLTSGDRDLPARQRTLRATIAWSHSLLDPEEQRLLRQLAVFQEGWTLEALEQVCYPEPHRHRALDALDSLVEKGLVRVVKAGKRYDLLETIRAFATEQLEESGETDATRASHADYYLDFAARVAADLRHTAQCEAMARAREDHANLLAAVRRFVAEARGEEATALEKGLVLCGHLNWYWHIAGHHMTGRALVDELLELAADTDPSPGRALSWLTAGMISTTTGELERSLGESVRACEDGQAIGDEEIVAEGRMYVGYCHLGSGRLDEAGVEFEKVISHSSGGVSDYIRALSMALDGMRRFAAGDLEGGTALVERARKIQQRLDDCEGGGVASSFLAQMTSARGDQEEALALYRDALALFERVGDHPEIARVLCEMGWTALGAGDQRDAQDFFRRAVLAYEAAGSPRGTGLAMLGLAAVEAAADRAERAVVIAAAADALSQRAGVVVEHPLAPEVFERIEALKASIPRSELDGIVADGSELTPAAVLAMIAD